MPRRKPLRWRPRRLQTDLHAVPSSRSYSLAPQRSGPALPMTLRPATLCLPTTSLPPPRQMRHKIRFALIVTRQILTVVETVAFAREPRWGSGRRSPRVTLLLRLGILTSSALAVIRAWRDLQNAEARPRRKSVRKSLPSRRDRRNRSGRRAPEIF